MPEPPTRYKELAELSAAEHAECQRAARCGEPVPRFETDAYSEYRAEVLRAGGLDEEAAEAKKDLDEMSPEDHFNRLQRP